MDTGSRAPGSAGAEEDRALVRAVRDGDPRAFDALALRHRQRIFAIALRVVGNREEARDVTQNALVRMWQMLPRYDERYAFTTWLYRMTVNLAIDAVRRAAPRRHDTELDEQVIAERAGSPASGSGPEQRFRAGEVERIFAELSGLLPPQQRAAFVLREMEGLGSDEVAEILGLSDSTVRNHVFQARKTLREELARRYPEYLPARRPRS